MDSAVNRDLNFLNSFLSKINQTSKHVAVSEESLISKTLTENIFRREPLVIHPRLLHFR